MDVWSMDPSVETWSMKIYINNPSYYIITQVNIITPVIIEILALSLAENGVIFC